MPVDENLRAEIRQLAEGVAQLAAQVKSFGGKVDALPKAEDVNEMMETFRNAKGFWRVLRWGASIIGALAGMWYAIRELFH